MTARIFKTRGRKPLAAGPVLSIGYAPAGIGGFPTNEACVDLYIGEEHHVAMTVTEWKQLQERITQLIAANT